jgi:ribosome biogenesis protein Nip4
MESYMIKKIWINPQGKKSHVLLTNGHSEVLERRNKSVMTRLVTILNENSEEGCGIYELITIHNNVH